MNDSSRSAATSARPVPDQASRHIGEPCSNLATRPLLSQYDRTALIQANNVERVLADFDADYGDGGLECLSPGVLLVFGAPASLMAEGEGARPDHPIIGHHQERRPRARLGSKRPRSCDVSHTPPSVA